ncbi:unnamed protein product [Pedinophyceae sp. YPF-701]|nr:unnamed protein product [Pedinophyceae sp. YPF-701]
MSLRLSARPPLVLLHVCVALAMTSAAVARALAQSACWGGTMSSWAPGNNCVATSYAPPCPPGTWASQPPLGHTPPPNGDFDLESMLAEREAQCASWGGTWHNRVCDAGLNSFNWCGAGRKVIALTFDDGPVLPASWDPSRPHTSAVLADLAAAGVRATFLISPAAIGFSPETLPEKCAVLQDTLAAGHEVQSHTWLHGEIPSTPDIAAELQTVQDWFATCTGGATPLSMVRPPYGVIDVPSAHACNDAGHIVATWSHNSDDWKLAWSSLPVSDKITRIINRIMHGTDVDTQQPLPGASKLADTLAAGDSATVLFHDQAYWPGIVPQLVAAIHAVDPAYEFVTASECFHGCFDLVCNAPHGELHCSDAFCGWG